ncbi:MAG: methyl-accepting chemotaxis protein [Treponema sp.]|nr:methyl-accepting chemotaxis protein [Candidatus Treponema equi]
MKLKKVLFHRSKVSFERNVATMIVPMNILANSVATFYCSSIARLSLDYTTIQLLWLAFISFNIVLFTELIFNHLFTRPLSNNITFWESAPTTPKERTELLKNVGRFPIKKALELVFIFGLIGITYSASAYHIMHVDLHIVIYYFHLYVSFSYLYILISIFIVEKQCSEIAIKLVSDGIALKEQKFFGLSQKTCFILYIIIPVIETAFLTFHSVLYAFHDQTLHAVTGTMTSRVLTDMEKLGLFIKTNLTKPEMLALIFKVSFLNTIFTCIILVFHYARIINSTKLMQKSLVLLKNKRIDQNNLFKVDMFTEESYTMHLINRTILLFDSLIRNNAKTNREIDEASTMLAMISAQTKENVIRQSSNIEEILATMQSVDNLSKKIENNFDEVITVASKTLNSVHLTSFDLNENLNKIHDLTSTNRITIDNLKKLSDKINGIQDVINNIDKVAEQTKTVAFNAELEANNIDIEGTNFSTVAEEIRRLSNNTTELTKRIHSQVVEITNASEDLIATGSYCMQKTEEGNEICIQLGEKFDEIKQSARETSSNSQNIKESLHEQTNAFHQIVETLSQIAKSVRNFGESSTTISETIEKLRDNSKHILAINSKYDNSDNKEGTAI